MRGMMRIVVIASLALGMAGIGIRPAGTAMAATDLVTSCNGSGAGSLPYVVNGAAGDDTITFAQDCSGTSAIPITSPISIADTLTIDGSGHSVVIDGGGTSQLFSVSSTANLTLNALTLQDGYTTCSGRCSAFGGAIYSKGTLTVTNSTFSDNTSSCSSGMTVGCQDTSGAVTVDGGSASIAGSTFVNNSVSCDGDGCLAYGGAIASPFGGATITVTNSTLTGNTASCADTASSCFAQGSAIYAPFSGTTVTVTNSTVAGNSASCAGPSCFVGAATVAAGGATVAFGGSIVADNANGNCAAFNTGSTLTDLGYNLDTDGRCTSGQTGDITGQEPGLGSLAANGGPTRTIALQSDSPAIDQIPTTYDIPGTTTPLCPSQDQRGDTRPDNSEGNCDIGAYEASYDETTTAVKSSGSPSTAGQSVIYTATVAPISPFTGTPSGTVTFYDGGSAISDCTNPATLTGGTATCQVTYAGGGSHTITVSYSGDSTYQASSTTSALTQQVSIPTPSITTTPEPTAVNLGTGSVTLKDRAVLSGGVNPTGTATFTLVAPGGATIDTETVSVNGNGSYATPTGYTLPTTGTVTGTYQWTVAFTDTDGNNTNASDTDDQGEQVTVSAASPTIETAASPISATVATALTDSATLSGGYHPMGTITFYLFAPGVTPNGTDSNNVYSDAVTVTGNGTYTTATGTNPGGYKSAAVGTYQWVAVYAPADTNNNGVASTFGDEPVAIQYGVKLLYKTPTNGKVGSTEPIKLELVNAAGKNLSSPSIGVQALCVVVQGTSDCSGTPSIGYGAASSFTYLASLAPGGGYQFNVKTTGLAAGKTYQLLFRAQSEPDGVYHVGPPAATFSLTK